MVRRVTSLFSQNYRRQCLIGPEKDGQAGHQLGLPELQKAVFDRTREGWMVRRVTSLGSQNYRRQWLI